MVESKKNLTVQESNGEWKLIEHEIEQPGEGQVLIKAHFSPINPHDYG
jgi:NADPH-dependent curcumin reductase CurA